MGGLPLLVTLDLDAAAFARLDALRARYFPPERNVVPAHVCLFHHLPAEEADAVDAELAGVAAGMRPFAVRFGGLKRLGGGMAVEVESADLKAIHARLAGSFHRWLTPQDRQPFRPHVTIMNKADRAAAAGAFDGLRAAWTPWSGTAEGLRLWAYLGGPWRPEARYRFGEGSVRTAPIEEVRHVR